MFRKSPVRQIESLESRVVLSATVFEHDGIGYFLQVGDPGFARYDIQNEQWLPRLDLSNATGSPSAAHIDDDGIYVAYGRAVYRYDLNGSSDTHLINANDNVHALHTDGDILFANHSAGLYTRYISINKVDNQVVDTINDYLDTTYGTSIAPEQNRIYGRSRGTSPADITFVSYTDDGRFQQNGDSRYHGDYPSASQVWLFDDGQRLVDSSGTIYSTSLNYLSSFQSQVVDVDFVGGEIPIVLSGPSLTAYGLNLLPAGSADLTYAATDLFVNDENAMAFSIDPTASQGWRVEIVSLTSLDTPEPGEPLNPDGLSFTPSRVELTNDGVALLFSPENLSVFRYDTITQSWGETIPLVDFPEFGTYSAETNTIYHAYSTGLLRKIDLNADEPTEEVFATLPQAPLGLATAGEFLFAVDPSGAWVSHYTFAPDGTQISAVEWNYRSQEYVWSEVNQKMYFFRDDTSPNDLLSEDIRADGSIGDKRDSPLHSSGGFRHPIRVAPNGSVVVLGSGLIHDANTLERLAQSLVNPVDDVTWLGDEAYSIRTLAGTSSSQIQRWSSATWGLTKSTQLEGQPISLKTVGPDRLLAITLDSDERPVLTLYDDNLDIVVSGAPIADAGPDVTIDVGALATLDASASYDPLEPMTPLSYSWTKLSGPGDVQFSAPNSAITTLSANEAGVFEVQLSVSDGTYTSSDTLRVTNRINLPPVLDTSNSITTGTAGRSDVTLTALGSYDPNGDAFSIMWSVESAPMGALWSLTSADGETTGFEADTPGTYVVRATASDGSLSSSTTFEVQLAANQAPVADGSLSDTSVVAGRAPATLDGRASTDAESDDLTYAWEIVSAPDGSSPVLSSAQAASTRLNATTIGDYLVRLTVSDGLAEDSTDVLVSITANQTPVADASRTATNLTMADLPARLDATASYDEDDATVAYSWRLLASSNPSSPTITRGDRSIASMHIEQPGSYAVELTVRDGASQSTDYLIITVSGNQTPIADATASDRIADSTTPLWLDAAHSWDPDGDPLTYTWTILAATTESPPTILDPGAARTQLQASSSGSITVMLEVSDGVDASVAFQLLTVRAPEQTVTRRDGDANLDGMVDFDDFLIFSRNFGATDAAFEDGDFDESGTIDFEDFLLLSQNFGSTSP